MHFGVEHTQSHAKKVRGEPHAHGRTCTQTDLSVKQFDCLCLGLVMCVMSFRLTAESNLASWILSIIVSAGVSRPEMLVYVCLKSRGKFG